MKCEICDVQTATMWVQQKSWWIKTDFGPLRLTKPVMSCEDCGPQLGYEILAPLTANIRSRD